MLQRKLDNLQVRQRLKLDQFLQQNDVMNEKPIEIRLYLTLTGTCTECNATSKDHFSSIQKLIMKQSHIKNLESMSLSDVYQDDKLPEGKKSYTLSFNLMDKTKTLSEKEISSSMSKIQSKIENEFSASLRS